MTFKEQEQFTKKNSDDLLTELSNYQGENLISEIVRLGIQNLMELERDEHIGVGNYERGEDRRSQRNGYKSRQLYTRVGTLVLQVPQTRDGAFYPSVLERYQRSVRGVWLLAFSTLLIKSIFAICIPRKSNIDFRIFKVRLPGSLIYVHTPPCTVHNRNIVECWR